MTPSFFDIANTLLGQVPVTIDTGTIDSPDGIKLGVLTFRTASTTLTVLLGADDVATWGELLTDLARSMKNNSVTPASMEDLAKYGMPDGKHNR